MKKLFFALNILLILGLACFAQSHGSGKANGSVKGASSVNANGGNGSLEAGTGIQAELQQTLDVKKAQVGDQVVMKVTKSVKQNGRTVVEKGSKVMGRITEVQQKTKNNTTSKLGVVFERIQGQNLDSPISASIVSFSQVATNAGVDDTLDAGVMGSSSSSGSISRGPSSSGGLLGGATGTVGGVVGTTSNTVGSVANTAGQTVGTVANTTKNTVGSTAQTVGRTINGINISPSVGASAQSGTTLSTQNKNLRLEKGATFQLQVIGSAGNN